MDTVTDMVRGKGEGLAYAVQHHEIIAKAVHFCKVQSHVRRLPLAPGQINLNINPLQHQAMSKHLEGIFY